MTNEQLYEAAKAAIVELFADASVSVEEARINLNTLIGEIELMRDSLPEIPETDEEEDLEGYEDDEDWEDDEDEWDNEEDDDSYGDDA